MIYIFTSNADNGFQLHKSPLIFLYEPEDFGIETINDINYWFMDFGYGIDSEEFSKLIEGQPFEFIDNKIFGLHYELKKEAEKWTGNNIYYHIKENVKTINKHDIITRVSIIVSKNDQLKLVLKKYWGLSNDGPHGISQFLYDNMT